MYIIIDCIELSIENHSYKTANYNIIYLLNNIEHVGIVFFEYHFLFVHFCLWFNGNKKNTKLVKII